MTPVERSVSRRIDLTSLQMFVSVCETGSIGKAAEREFIAPSALSKRLSDLEIALGSQLLQRHSRGAHPTPAGQSLLHHARSLLFSLDRMHSELTDYADGARGQVRVHASISATVQFLPEDLGAFTRTHQGIKIDLEEHLSSEVIRAVQEGAADFGVCNTADGVGELQTLPYRQDQLVLIVPATHALARRTELTFAETLHLDHVGLHSNSSIYGAMRQAAAAMNQTIKLRIQVSGLDALCRMVLNGLGVGIMPLRAFTLMHGTDPLAAVPLSDPWAHRHIELVARDFSTLPRSARLLVDHLKSTL